MSVDSATARRDARRRRILENSEKRLNKIINCDNTRSNDVGSTVNSLKNEWEHCNGMYKTTQPDEIASASEFPQNLYPQDEILNENITEATSETEINENLLLLEEPMSGDKKIEDKNQVILWSDCFFIVFVSIIVRLMYNFKMSSLFAESLFVPFITVFLAKLAANPSKHTSKSVPFSGMLRASLLLSGVPNTWLDKIFMCMQTCIDLGHDFALYFFSFTISHIFLETLVNR